MNSLVALAQALGIAYAAGFNLYATVAVLGVAERMGWIGVLPPGLSAAGSLWIIGIAGTLYLLEFMATLIPGVASAWETLHSLIRPPAAAVLAVATVWQGDATLVLAAALLGGGLAVTTTTTKLGLRYAIDTSPEPVTNGVANVAELGLVTTLGIAIWHYPLISLTIALILLVLLVLLVRQIWRALRQVFSGRWMPACGLLQEPRASARPIPVLDED